jgi:Do/DeqQ family serine protease
MTKFSLDRKTTLLAGIGLVLVGLLAGVLLMLTTGRPRPVVMTRQAEPVRIGGEAEPAKPAALSDSGEAQNAAAPQQRRATELTDLNRRFRKMTERIRPAVVSIRVQSQEGADWFDGFRKDDRGFFKRRKQRRSAGSGVLITEKGHIVTNSHVVKGAGAIQVTLVDKREYEAEVVGNDPSTDMAVLKIGGDDLPAATLGNSDNVKVGDRVLAVGNPFGLSSTVTAGIVSALGRQVGIINDRFRIENFIQTDAAINPGNSGGALVNMKGELIGISTAIATEDGTNAGYGFAVPSNLMERVAKDLIAYGEVRRGYLGVSISEVNADRARDLGLESIAGVYVADVRSSGAADRAGLCSGDVVLAVEGRPVNAPNELQSAIARHHPGDRLTVKIWREGARKRYEVELMSKDAPAYASWFDDSSGDDDAGSPDGNDNAPRDPSGNEVFELGEWGVGVQPLSEDDRQDYDVQRGVYVAYVEKGGPAGRAGLPRGVVLKKVAGQPVSSIEDVLKAFGHAGASEAVLLRVKRRDGQTAFYEVEPPR